jgi:hypothetical protein
LLKKVLNLPPFVVGNFLRHMKFVSLGIHYNLVGQGVVDTPQTCH